MKKVIIAILLIVFTAPVLHCQKIRNVNIKDKKNRIAPYDSLSSIDKRNYKSHIGQILYLKGSSYREQRGGYKNFYTNLGNFSKYDDKNVYRQTEKGYYSDYHWMRGRYFRVNRIFMHPESKTNTIYKDCGYLQLVEQQTKDTLYYMFYGFGTMFEDFVTLGYIEKLKKRYVGKKYVHDLHIRNMEDGSYIEDIPGETIWELTDVAIRDTKEDPVVAILSNSSNKNAFVALKYIDLLEREEKYEKRKNENTIKYKNHTPYDSLSSINKQNYKSHIGQTIHLRPSKKAEEKGGYDSFFTKFGDFDVYSDRNTYKPIKEESLYSRYNYMKDREFFINDIFLHPDAKKFSLYNNYVYLQLVDTQTKDTLYYYYGGIFNFENFITLGYIDKLKSFYKGKQYMHDNQVRSLEDGTYLDAVSKETIWQCVDVQIRDDENNPVILILEDDKGLKGFIVLENFYKLESKQDYQTREDRRKFQDLVSRFGIDYAEIIVKNQIQEGFTKDMVIASWGEPIKKDTIYVEEMEDEDKKIDPNNVSQRLNVQLLKTKKDDIEEKGGFLGEVWIYDSGDSLIFNKEILYRIDKRKDE
ncbi:MAG: hypothetical protein LBM25_04065 [Bacteroidales bacterium]|jgi:hypothetical protein|nr:hypothetical protein [Bacteroidales bacterium]